jgi:hypothetical protein
LLDLFGRMSAADVLAVEKGRLAERITREAAYGEESRSGRSQ